MISGIKSEREKFAGALATYAIEALMSDGKALQMGTSHNLGQHFSKVFNIRYEDRKLEDIFGDQWRNWSQGIPAMIPVRFNWKSNTDASWNARQSLLRNGELPITVYLLFCAWLMLNRMGMF